MIQNPFLPAPTAASALAEGFTKGFAAISSPEPGENVLAEDIDTLTFRRLYRNKKTRSAW